ncbi:pilus assembly protein TadG-related protein [Arthrobacter sp. TMN-37]
MNAGRRSSPGRGIGWAGEDGQVGVLIIGYLLLLLLVLAVVLAASAVYLGHSRLLSVADGAALAAADTFTIDASADTGPQPVLDPATVRFSAEGYVQRTGAGQRFPSLAVGPATGTPDGRTAQVVLTAVVHPPLVTVLVPDGIPITATADARSELTR